MNPAALQGVESFGGGRIEAEVQVRGGLSCRCVRRTMHKNDKKID